MHLIIDRFLSRSLSCSLPAAPALPPLPRAAVCRAAHRIALGHLEDPAVDLVLLLPLDGCPRARTCCCLHSRCRCCCCCPSLAVIFVGAGSATTAVVVNIVTASALALFHRPNGQTAGPSPSPGPAAPRTPRTPCLSGPACNPASRATLPACALQAPPVADLLRQDGGRGWPAHALSHPAGAESGRHDHHHQPEAFPPNHLLERGGPRDAPGQEHQLGPPPAQQGAECRWMGNARNRALRETVRGAPSLPGESRSSFFSAILKSNRVSREINCPHSSSGSCRRFVSVTF